MARQLGPRRGTGAPRGARARRVPRVGGQSRSHGAQAGTATGNVRPERLPQGHLLMTDGRLSRSSGRAGTSRPDWTSSPAAVRLETATLRGVASNSPDPGAPRFPRGTPEFDRALAFFDATYAVALTLLVTTLDGMQVPGAWADLAALWAAIGNEIVAFFLAFAIVAFY